MQPSGYNLALVALVAGAAAAGLWVLRKKRDWPPLDRFLASLLAVGFLVLAVTCVSGVLRAPFFGWNGARLAPTFALVKGYRLYYPDGVGPVLNTIYGPVTALVYLPATLAQSPTVALMVASMISLALVFAPAVWLLALRRRWSVGLAALVCFGLLVMRSYPVKYAAFCVHADAPALGLAGLACAAIYRRKDSGDWKWLGAAAALAVLSVWAKQTMLLLPIALAFCVGRLFGVDGLKRYLLALCGAGAVATAVFVLAFGWGPLWFNLVTVPSRHPWQGERLGCLLQAVQELAVSSAFALVLIVIGFVVRRRWGGSIGRWPVFAVAGAFNIPAALLNLVKAGGDLNALSLTVYFWLLAAMLCLAETAEAQDGRLAEGAKMGLALLLAGLLVSAPLRWQSLPNVWRSLDNNPQAMAWRILARHPGQVYFPDNPLAHLMAEGRLYHLSYGLIDRELGGFPVGEKQFRAHLPPEMKVILFGSLCAPADSMTQKAILKRLPDYVLQGKDPRGWTVCLPAKRPTN